MVHKEIRKAHQNYINNLLDIGEETIMERLQLVENCTWIMYFSQTEIRDKPSTKKVGKVVSKNIMTN